MPQIMAFAWLPSGRNPMAFTNHAHDHELFCLGNRKHVFRLGQDGRGAGRQEAELRRDDDLPARFSEVASDRAPLLNAKGGLSARHTHQIQQFLKENFSRKLSLAEMAAVCDLSPYHFVRAFSKTFGVSPYQSVLLLRLDLAQKLLAESGMSITDIADLSGFSSQSHFTTMMKKYRHVTPQQVRTGQRRSRSRN